MRSDPSSPLHRLPELTVANSNAEWPSIARQACRESLARIDHILADTHSPDRDTHACLLAIAKSLQWVIQDSSSTDEIAVTVRRALQVLDRMAVTREISAVSA